MPYINLKTPIPGPKSQELNARRAAAVTSALAQANPIAVKKAHGSLVEDADGNTLIDLAGGIGMMAVGHTPQAVVEAIKAQADELLHICSIVANYEPYVALCEALNRLTPGDFPKKTLLSSGGAEAVENAVKFARRYTGRSGILVFEGAYHGRSNLTMAMTSKWGLFKKGFGPFASEVYRLPLPNLYRTPQGMTPQEYVEWSCWNLENALTAHIDPSALAAIVIEPVLGEGGFIPVPHEFLRKIREVCDQTGAVMIADEIQSGSGRTGKLWAIEHSGVVPDLIISAKSLGAGMPISAVTGRAEILDSPHVGGVGSTYGGNPLACVAALKALEILQSPGFLERAQHIERIVRETFEPIQSEVVALGDVRGVGAMMALEFVKDKASKEPWSDFTMNTIKAANQNGVILIRAGLYTNCIRFLPALDIPEDMLREALEVVANAIRTTHQAMAATA
ncbi:MULTISPECIES: aspartate aminotransferase family protein [unclassified Meiothermus]|uniref:aspartate aminotransferase family protein n=1 Tax=unclassified Meiothermus TaxID=370471 RepID=UPI000D7C84AF|nr:MULTISPECIES: aminotransferase class III-fold pyridoxal phosphate-dependent enzyme [unclassified Meiothermus]PZA07873.1 4-aminobutyrate--2-oxoglutarate transaminase [Meiothermus sp. Pnk-1]RYM38822.1 aminotransferase class III-fold pyridoxal phosphate-dependent enzyme [Meiothermus sp. PNK-Is4]